MKRTIDLVVAGCILVVASPLMAVVAVLVRFRMGAPIIFRQERAGLGGLSFTLYKFRTMSPSITVNPSDESQRLTKLGATLRRHSLDELPQLWNVMKGDMSLVGPRPLPTAYLPRYSKEQWRRHSVLPGITGWAQVNGRNRTSWDHRLSLDIWYVDNRSTTLDLKILIRTLTAVLFAKDISPQNGLIMEEFRGPTQ